MSISSVTAASSSSFSSPLESLPACSQDQKYPNLTSAFLSRVSSVGNEGSSETLTHRNVSVETSTKKKITLSELTLIFEEWLINIPDGASEKFFSSCPIMKKLKECIEADRSKGVPADTEVEIELETLKKINKEGYMQSFMLPIDETLLQHLIDSESGREGLIKRLKIRLDEVVDSMIEEYFKKDLHYSGGKESTKGSKAVGAATNTKLALAVMPGFVSRMCEIALDELSKHVKSEKREILVAQGKNLASQVISNKVKNLERQNERRLVEAKKIFEEERRELSFRLEWCEKKGCSLEEMSYEKAEELQVEDTALWIREMEQEKRKKRRRKRGKAVNRVMAQKDSAVACSSNTQKEKGKSSRAKKRSPEEIRGLFVQSIYANGARYRDAERVSKRWQTTDCSVLRALEDKDKSRQPILRYKHLTDAEILKQRARHYLPGADRILSNGLFREIFSFSHGQEGFGMMAELDHGNGVCEWGYLFFGIDGNRVYHRYFEPIYGKEKRGRSVSDSKDSFDHSSSCDDWNDTVGFAYSMGSNGVLSLTFSGEKHSLHIYPLRKDLLDRSLLSI